MKRFGIVMIAGLFLFTGVAVAQEDARYGLGGTFSEDRTDEDLRDFKRTTDGYRVHIMESYPEQFGIAGLGPEECKRLHGALAEKDYIARLAECRQMDGDTKPDGDGRPDEPPKDGNGTKANDTRPHDGDGRPHDPPRDAPCKEADDRPDCQPRCPRDSDRASDRCAPSCDQPDRPDQASDDRRPEASCHRPLKHIQFERAAGGLTNYTVDGVLVFERLALRGWADEGKWVREGNHIIYASGHDRIMLTDNPTGLVAFQGRGDGTFLMDFPEVKMEGTDDGIRVEGRGFSGFLHGEDLQRSGAGHVIHTDDAAKFHIRPGHAPGHDQDDRDVRKEVKRVVRDHDDDIRKAIEKRHVGGEVILRKVVERAGEASIDTAGGDMVLVYDDVNVTVQRPDGDGASPLRVVFDADLESGRTFVLDVDPALFRGDLALRYWDIHADGNETEVVFNRASDLADVLDPDDDGGQPEYWIVRDANGIQVLVSVPHWSVHAVSIQGIGAFLVQPSVLVGAAAGVAGVVIAALVMFWPRRRPE